MMKMLPQQPFTEDERIVYLSAFGAAVVAQNRDKSKWVYDYPVRMGNIAVEQYRMLCRGNDASEADAAAPAVAAV